MKHSGNISDFISQRQEELLNGYFELARSHPSWSMESLCRMLVRQPASRFWITEQRAMEVYFATLRGQTPRFRFPAKERMHAEIFRRVSRRREVLASTETEPGCESQIRTSRTRLYEIFIDVINSPAPEHYMEPVTARTIIYNRLRARPSRIKLVNTY